MTHDTDHPKQTVEEPEHGVFVPPNEQHVREDGEPTSPASPTEYADRADADRDQEPDRVDAVGTEAVPHSPEATRDPDPTLFDSQAMPATPLDTGTAEDAERAEETGAEDETRTLNADARDIDADPRDVDPRDADPRDVDPRDADPRDVDPRDADPRDVDARNTDARNADELEVDEVDEHHVHEHDVDEHDVDADTGDVAVGTAAVPEQATAPTTDFWPAGVIDDLRSRWDAVQIRFVDDPSGVAADAKALVGEAVGAVRQAIDRIEERLDEKVSDENDETERLRQQVAHYRNVFESLLSR